jgi:dinuclear metal center YbgI/SA1388 family protein
MANRDEITQFCNELLGIEQFAPIDYGPNGLQVPGAAEVSKVATCVSANLASLQAAVAEGAEMVLAHHGLFWEFHPRALTDQMAARLRVLIESNTTLLGYHLPLDAHPEIGNNVLLCRALGFEPGDPFADHKGQMIGCVGVASEPDDVAAIAARISRRLDREPLVQGKLDGEISTVGFVTGAGGSYVHEAVALGLDALVTGEPAEHVMADATEGDLAFFAAGHYATETLGIRRLGEVIADQFRVDHVFVDVPNPV